MLVSALPRRYGLDLGRFKAYRIARFAAHSATGQGRPLASWASAPDALGLTADCVAVGRIAAAGPPLEAVRGSPAVLDPGTWGRLLWSSALQLCSKVPRTLISVPVPSRPHIKTPIPRREKGA